MANIKTHRPKKRWSQNFLKDDNIARKIANTLKIPSPGLIIEIGPGHGILTYHLLDKAKRLLAIEIDPVLAEQLPRTLEMPENLVVIQQDFIGLNISKILNSSSYDHVAIIGNLPYHITSPILFKVLEQFRYFQLAVFTVQKEVAQRIAAKPSSKKYGILSVFCQFYAIVEYLFSIPATVFYPKPQVDSGVIRLTFQKEAEKVVLNPSLFREIVRQTFGQRRKMLRNTLSNLFSETILGKLSLDLTRRPETLSVSEFIDLANQLQKIQMGD